jgi:hypothetical protein
MDNGINIKIRSEYVVANCCGPQLGDPITGYHSHDDCIKIHRASCANLASVEQDRLVHLEWRDVILRDEFIPDDLYTSLEENDLRILAFHREVGVDYSLKAAKMLRINKREVFDRHKKLRTLGLLRRVKKVMIQYRKGIVDNKWIKHRNHTYYELTEKGRAFAEHYATRSGRS